MIAEVVVDIKNKAVNKVFDYLVPEELRDVIQSGVRVLVPFGPRTVMGFVISLKEGVKAISFRLYGFAVTPTRPIFFKLSVK